MSKKYLMKLAIDFGSTNTVMAWRVYERTEDGKLQISEQLNKPNNVIKIPSIMFFADENPESGAVKNNLFGKDAMEYAENGNNPPVIHDNFKQILYYDNAYETPEYKKGVELCTRFFEHLRSKYREEIINSFNTAALKDLEVVLYLSTPVRAHFTHRNDMRKIAVEAGFTEENYITEINTCYDEATCVVRYAIAARKDDMKEVLAKAGTERGALLLFVDAGGSTVDSCIERIHIKEDKTLKLDPVAVWPSSDVKYALGGCLIDEAIRDYLIAEGYADKEYTLQKWESRDGKLRFRKFKEENNKNVEVGEISNLGKLAQVCYDYEEGIIPDKRYNKSSQKINTKIFEEEICAEYIQNFKEALKELFDNQRETQYGPVTPADIDGIFLSGAGSNLYFIPRLILEYFDEETAGHSKVRENRAFLFNDWEDPSLCCALGALTKDDDIEVLNYSKEDYYITLQIYSHDATIEQALKKGAVKLSSDIGIFEIDGEKHTCVCVTDQNIKVANKHQLLPAVLEINKNISYDDNLEDYITVQMVAKRLKEDGSYDILSAPYINTTSRVFSDKTLFVVKVAFMAVGLIPILATTPIDWVIKKLGGKGELTEAYCEGVGNFLMPTRKVELNFSARVELTEHNSISVKSEMQSQYFKFAQSKISVDI